MAPQAHNSRPVNITASLNWLLSTWAQYCPSWLICLNQVPVPTPLLLITPINILVLRFIVLLNSFFTFLGCRNWGQWLLHREGPHQPGEQDGGQRWRRAGHMQHGRHAALHQPQQERIQVTATAGLHRWFMILLCSGRVVGINDGACWISVPVMWWKWIPSLNIYPQQPGGCRWLCASSR